MHARNFEYMVLEVEKLTGIREFIAKKKIYPMESVATTSSEILGIEKPSDALNTLIEEVVRDLKPSFRLGIISLDALGLYAWYFHRESMPFLTSHIVEKSVILKAVMPSITPVNHATMVSGVPLEIHGIRTYDDNFKCETIFDVLRRRGLSSMGCGRPNWTGHRLLARYADIKCISPESTDDSLLETFLEKCEKSKPTYFIIQFGDPDDYFHKYGPYSNRVSRILYNVDRRLKTLIDVLGEEYSFMILADHGQHTLITKTGEIKGKHGKSYKEDLLVPLTWIKSRKS